MTDEIAGEYLLIGLGLGQLEEGIVDSYFGPPEIAEQARAERAAPLALAARARALRDRLVEIEDSQRAAWLDRQLVALETLAQRVAGDDMAYSTEVERCFDARPEPTPPAAYAATRRDLDELLPGSGDLRPRLAQRDERLAIDASVLPEIIGWLMGELRAAATRLFDVPSGEQLDVELVHDKPWAAYNWYRGGLRSLIEINMDLPVRAHQLVPLLAHEAFPGHHLEHATKEAVLVDRQSRLEACVLLINTPEAYISEGLAEAGLHFVAPAERWQSLLIEICGRAGIALDPNGAEREWRISQALHRLRGSAGDAALQLYVGGRSRDEVISFLEHDALRTREQAEKNLEFITHPLWRTYVFCYAGGERLLGAWLDQAATDGERRSRFSRLLSEQLTPSGIAAETAGRS
jgi:hypothetical protein